jgi:hypothetical protein
MQRLPLALIVALALTACGRPLAPEAAALLAPLHGGTLDATRMRIAAAPVGAFPITYDARPRVTCQERIGPPQEGRITVPPAGIVLFETLLLRPDLAAVPLTVDGALNLPWALFLAHEATHVWQWQNRDVTGYHPARAFAEQVTLDDPYLLAGDARARFLDYGYEQQATLVAEYLCCAVLDPDAARTGRLRALLAQAMPVAPPEAFAQDAVLLPPGGDPVRGICEGPLG